MTPDQLRKFLELDDLVFTYKDKAYYICPFLTDGYYSAGEADHDDTEYKTFDGLLNDFIIDGKPLIDILKDIDW